jgi:hypothetical protein
MPRGRRQDCLNAGRLPEAMEPPRVGPKITSRREESAMLRDSEKGGKVVTAPPYLPKYRF